MKIRLAPLLGLAVLAVTPAPLRGQPAEAAERLAAACALALGRLPTAEEMRPAAEAATAPVAGLLAQHRARLRTDAAARRAMLVRAAEDALGRAPSESELAGWTHDDRLYFEWVEQHRQWLAEHADAYQQVLARAYARVLQRAPYPVEFDYWKKYHALPFVLLVGCVENWARRNAPGLMATTGTPTIAVTSDLLATLRLSPAAADEVRTAIGLAATDAAPRTAAGRHVIAPGAEEIVSVGHVHFVVVGLSAR
jgi:hypothetical protein